MSLCSITFRLYTPIVVSGYKVMTAQDCTYDDVTTIVEMSLVLPQLNISMDKYTLSGSLLGNIVLSGEGAAR